MFFGKTLCLVSASLHSDVVMGTGKFSGKPGEMLGGNLAIHWHPILLLNSSCYGTLTKLQPQTLHYSATKVRGRQIMIKI